jgi:hypothetical protein
MSLSNHLDKDPLRAAAVEDLLPRVRKRLFIITTNIDINRLAALAYSIASLVAKGAIWINGEDITVRLVQHPDRRIVVRIETASMEHAPEVKGEACGPRFGLHSHFNELLTLKRKSRPLDFLIRRASGC